MTRPLTHATERVLTTMARGNRYTSMRIIAVASGIVREPVARNSSALRLAQRTVTRLVKRGLIKRSISTAKVDNYYTLSPAGRVFAATEFPEQVSARYTTEQQPHAESPP